MTGTALPLPARIIGPAFITNKGAFWSFLPRCTSLMLCRPQDDGRTITSDSGCRERMQNTPIQVSVTDGDFRLFHSLWLGMVGNPQPCPLWVIGRSWLHRQSPRSAPAGFHTPARGGSGFALYCASAMSPIALPLNLPSMISSSLATTAVRRSLSRRYSAKKVKPPEAIALSAQRFQLEYQLR